MIDITLAKAKYRQKDRRLLHRSALDPAEGTLVWMAESHAYKSRTGNSNGIKKTRNATRPRKKAYGPW